jgi:hypothetical protein
MHDALVGPTGDDRLRGDSLFGSKFTSAWRMGRWQAQTFHGGYSMVTGNAKLLFQLIFYVHHYIIACALHQTTLHLNLHVMQHCIDANHVNSFLTETHRICK